MTDIFRKITAAEYRATLKLENLMFINGRAVNSEDELCAACVDWWDSVSAINLTLSTFQTSGNVL